MAIFVILAKMASISRLHTCFFTKFLKFYQKGEIFYLKMTAQRQFFTVAKNCQVFHFWLNLKKQPYIFAFFPKFNKKFQKISNFWKKSEKWAYNKKIHTKTTILLKLSKNQLFSLKIVLQ